MTLATSIALALQQLCGLSGDNKFLVRRHDPNLGAALGRIEPGLAPSGLVQPRVEHDAQLGEIPADGRADGRSVLADPAGEYDRVGAAQLDQVGARW